MDTNDRKGIHENGSHRRKSASSLCRFVSIRVHSWLISFHRNWFPALIDSYERKDTVCDAKLFASHITRYPHLYWNRHRSSADSFYPRITSNGVPYPDWLKKRHSFHRNGHNARLRGFRCKNPAAEVHLRSYPSTKNVAIWIGVHRHCDRLNNQFASGLFGHLESF